MPKAKARAKARAAAAAANPGAAAIAAYEPSPRGPFGGASQAAFTKLIEYTNLDQQTGGNGKIVVETARGQCGETIKKIVTHGLARCRLKTADVEGGHDQLTSAVITALKPLVEGFYHSRRADQLQRFPGSPAGAVVIEFNNTPLEHVMLEEQADKLTLGSDYFSLMYYGIPTLQKYFVQRWNEEAQFTVEKMRELMGELNGLVDIRTSETEVLVLNSFKSNGTPLKGQDVLPFFNMVPCFLKLAATPVEKTKVLTGAQYDELCTAAGMREVQALEIQLPDGGARFYDFNAASSGVKVDPSIFAQVTPQQQHAALTRFVEGNMRIIAGYAAQQSKKYGAGAMFLFTKSAFDDLIEINPAFDWTGAGPGGWKGEGEQPAKSGCRLDRQYLLAWGVDDSVRDEDMEVGQFTAEELSVDMRQFTKSLKKAIDEGDTTIAFPLVICADPTSEGTPEHIRHQIMPNASGLYPEDAAPGETCAVVIGAVQYPLDKETKRKRVEHAVAVAKAKADGTEAPAALSQLSDRDQYLATMKAHGINGISQHFVSYFMDRPE